MRIIFANHSKVIFCSCKLQGTLGTPLNMRQKDTDEKRIRKIRINGAIGNIPLSVHVAKMPF